MTSLQESTGLHDLGYDSKQGQHDFSSSQKHPDQLWGPTSLLFNGQGIGVLLLGVRQPGCEAGHSHPPSAKIWNECSNNSTPPVCLHNTHGQIYLYKSVKFYMQQHGEIPHENHTSDNSIHCSTMHCLPTSNVPLFWSLRISHINTVYQYHTHLPQSAILSCQSFRMISSGKKPAKIKWCFGNLSHKIVLMKSHHTLVMWGLTGSGGD